MVCGPGFYLEKVQWVFYSLWKEDFCQCFLSPFDLQCSLTVSLLFFHPGDVSIYKNKKLEFSTARVP